MSGRKLWMIALAVWFLLYGLLAITNFRFDLQGFVMGALAIVVAVLVALDR
jgi:hypothetical protein